MCGKSRCLKCCDSRQSQVNEISTLLHYYTIYFLRWFKLFKAPVVVEHKNIDHTTLTVSGSTSLGSAADDIAHDVLQSLNRGGVRGTLLGLGSIAAVTHGLVLVKRDGTLAILLNPGLIIIMTRVTVQVTGTVRERDSKNPKIPTGDIEIVPTEVRVLGKCRYNELPFEVNRSREADETARLKYRYLDLRNPEVKDNIVLRCNVVAALRQAMTEHGFLEITTPILTASSPEGARDYLVPARKHPGQFYALPQAPQQLLDMEMAFATQEDVFTVLEDVLPPIFAKYGKYDPASEAPFLRIPYLEALEKYGTDKPDLRIDLICQDITAHCQGTEFPPFNEEGAEVKAVVVSGSKLTRKQIDALCADTEVQSGKKPYWFRMDENGELVGGVAKFFADRKDTITDALGLQPDCLVGIAVGPRGQAQKTIGVMRNKLGAAVEGHMKKEQYSFCWIVDFPMYEIGEESGELEFCHNPFSMPNGGLETLLKAERGEIDPLAITADQYDLVCNGVELSSGAVRNHDPEIMVKAFEMVRLGEEDVKQRFPAMYNAFCYGAPPHAGIAPGVDRMVMLLAGEDSIREVIPFPMNKNAQDIMMGAPGTVDPKQLEELHIAVTAVEEAEE